MNHNNKKLTQLYLEVGIAVLLVLTIALATTKNFFPTSASEAKKSEFASSTLPEDQKDSKESANATTADNKHSNDDIQEAIAEGVRPEVAFVQTMKETGFLQYGGDASIEQFNFAGLGTTGGGVPGNSYPDVRTGIRAQIQHLKAYATADPLNKKCVDDRYEYVKKVRRHM